MLQVGYSLDSWREKAEQILCESHLRLKDGQETYDCKYYQAGKECRFLGSYQERREKRLPHAGGRVGRVKPLL